MTMPKAIAVELAQKAVRRMPVLVPPDSPLHERLIEALSHELQNRHFLKAMEENGFTFTPPPDSRKTPDLPPNTPMSEWKEFEIWCEGFSATGESAPCHLVGTSRGRNFVHACHNYALSRVEWGKNFAIRDGVPSHWGCRLYDNRADAAKAFG